MHVLAIRAKDMQSLMKMVHEIYGGNWENLNRDEIELMYQMRYAKEADDRLLAYHRLIGLRESQ